jgi:hypothetical protein
MIEEVHDLSSPNYEEESVNRPQMDIKLETNDI